MFDFLYDPSERQRKKQLRRATNGALKHYLSLPHPKKRSQLMNTPFLAVKFVTSGRDVRNAHILSIGFVEINHLGIQLGTANQQSIQMTNKITSGYSATHNIIGKEQKHGVSLDTAIAKLLHHLRGRALLAHHAHTELSFINTSCKKLYGIEPSILAISSSQMAASRLQKSQRSTKSTDLKLHNLRRSYDLPEYPANSALYDAIATAELFLAELNQLPLKHKTPLEQVLSTI